MTSAEFDLDRYLARIGYAGTPGPDRATLDEIIAAHARRIPFENLDPFLGRPNKLDLPSLQRKLVDSGRGGYCFEHNLLLRSALLAIGFDVTGLAARVLWGAPADAITARSHMLLLVGFEGERRIADVGFGGMTLTGSLRLERDTVQATPLEPFRLIALDGDYGLQAKLPDGWRTTYRFDLTRQFPVDYEAANWYLSTWPGSHFVTGLRAARATDDRRYALSGTRLTIHHPDGRSERHELAGPAELRRSLEADFRIDTSGLPDLDEHVACPH